MTPNAPTTNDRERLQVAVSDSPQWFFGWITGKPYITTACGWYRKQVIREAEQSMSLTWKQIYARGGRAIRCQIKVMK